MLNSIFFYRVLHFFKRISAYNLRIFKVFGNVTLGKKVFLESGTLIYADKNSKVILMDSVIIRKNTSLSASCGSEIVIGPNTTIQKNCSIDGSVSIGADCILAPNIYISSSQHVFEQYPGYSIHEQDKMFLKEFKTHPNSPVNIGNNCWIGINVSIMPGVTIGNGCIIGANSVVTKNCLDDSIYGGIPAKLIRYKNKTNIQRINEANNKST